jgi:hypothetical protein
MTAGLDPGELRQLEAICAKLAAPPAPARLPAALANKNSGAKKEMRP